MKVRREDQTKVQTLSLGERVAIKSQAWDKWALHPMFKGSFPPWEEERYVPACKFPRK